MMVVMSQMKWLILPIWWQNLNKLHGQGSSAAAPSQWFSGSDLMRDFTSILVLSSAELQYYPVHGGDVSSQHCCCRCPSWPHHCCRRWEVEIFVTIGCAILVIVKDSGGGEGRASSVSYIFYAWFLLWIRCGLWNWRIPWSMIEVGNSTRRLDAKLTAIALVLAAVALVRWLGTTVWFGATT
jgi:hypothetical protein